jgi:hypothetical protein
MALRKNYQVVCFGTYNLPWAQELAEEKTFTLANAYVKVLSVEGTKESLRAKVQIAADGKSMVKNFSFAPNMDGDNFIRQAYKHLKTLQEFDGAEDC